MTAAAFGRSPELGEADFEAFFLQEYGRVVAIAYQIVGERSEAEDVAQEAFASLVRRRRWVPSGSSWLRVAAAHLALNHVRARKRRLERELRTHRLALRYREGDERASDPQDIVDRAYDRSCVRLAMSRLPIRDARLLALRYGGLSYREIGETLKIDVGHVGTLLARAQRAFRKEIERVTT